MCTRYPIINRVSESKVHIELTRFVQPEKIEIDANERAVNEKSQYCFFVCTTFDSFLNDLRVKSFSSFYHSFYWSAINLSNQVSIARINLLAPDHSCSISSKVLCFTYFCTYTQQATPLASDTMSAILLNAFLQKKHFLIIFYLKGMFLKRAETLNLNFYDSFFFFFWLSVCFSHLDSFPLGFRI